MSTTHLAMLRDRGVISVTGEDAAGFLDNMITNDMAGLAKTPAIHAALLTPQGKILFEFFVVRSPDGFLLETAAEKAPDLVKRLGLYKLRAKVAITDVSASRVVVAAWGGPPPDLGPAVTYADPRHPALGSRLLMPPDVAAALHVSETGASAYHAHRIALGVPEAGRDYALGDTFPHEANFDRLQGVSFTKGCFVGQEVVARMQHKTVVRKRVVPVTAEADLVEGAPVRFREAVIGTIGSVAGHTALALLRLDRAEEAKASGAVLTAGETTITVDSESLRAYAAGVASRSAT